MEQETKISLYTFIGMALTCLAIGWLIKDRVDSIIPFVIFLVGILGCFGLIYRAIDEKRWEGIVRTVRDEFSHKK
jgi:hypothetical protein